MQGLGKEGIEKRGVEKMTKGGMLCSPTEEDSIHLRNSTGLVNPVAGKAETVATKWSNPNLGWRGEEGMMVMRME